MRILDLIIQTLLAGLALEAAVSRWLDHDVTFNFMGVQFLMGSWQMASSLVSLVRPGPLFKGKLVHFTAASLYLISLFAIPEVQTDIPAWYFIGPPWVLAAYYYLLTWKSVLVNRKQPTRFLPHTNF
ncbi:MAG TPA: hypothetical protein VEB86_15375 [Chryseosolibacter sp.]|nr:hypothetical protein [Chryseosolibacter sp.]